MRYLALALVAVAGLAAAVFLRVRGDAELAKLFVAIAMIPLFSLSFGRGS